MNTLDYTAIPNENLRELCIKNGWFTDGSNTQYKKLFKANESKCSLNELATIIWLCTDAKWCRRDIRGALEAENNKWKVGGESHEY